MDLEQEHKIFFGIDGLLMEHDCDDWEDFREFVHFATDDVADVGYISGDEETDSFGSLDLEEKSGIYFLTKEGVSSILYFPFTFDDLNREIEKMEIFKN